MSIRSTPKGSNAGRKRGNVPLLTLEQRKMIRALFDAGAKYRELAEEFKVSIGTIQRVVSYHSEQKDKELSE